MYKGANMSLYRHVKRRVAVAAGASLALLAATCVAVVAGQAPAYADVTTGNYTIGSPTPAVSAVTVSPTSTKDGAYTDFAVTFDAGVALSGASKAWVTVAPSAALGASPAKVQLIGGQCLQAGTAGDGGDGTATTTGVTIELKSSCSISAGAKVEVDFDADAPPKTGTFSFAVTTSANSTPATSSSVSVGSSDPVLSAVSHAFGDNTKYTIDNVSVAKLSSDGTTLTVKAVATAGSATITFYDGASGYAVTYISSSGTSVTDPVQKVDADGKQVTLTLADAVADGGTLQLTADGTNPAKGSSTEEDAISVQPGNGTVGTSNSITFGGSVSGLSTSLSTMAPGASATYTIGFKATDAIASGGYVYLSELDGPTDFTGATGVLVEDNTAHWHFVATSMSLKDGTASIALNDAVLAGASLSITMLQVVNPPSAGTVGDLGVSTSSDPVVAYAPAYYIGVGANPAVVVGVNPSGPGALAAYSISNLYASKAMPIGTWVTLNAPSGTVWPNDANDYAVEDATSPSSSGASSGVVSGGGTSKVTFKVSKAIAQDNTFSLDIQDTVNPSKSSSTDSIIVLGNIVGAPPTTTTTTTAPTTTTTTTAKAHKPAVAELTAKALLHGHKSLQLKLRCRYAACKGTVKLVDVRTVLAKKAYSVRGGRTGTVRLSLASKAIRVIKRAKHHTVNVKLMVSVRGGKAVSRKLTIVGGSHL